MIRANRAKQIIDDELFQEALKGIREEIVANWQKVPLKDGELLGKFHMLYGLVDKLEVAFRSYMEDGEVASFELVNKKKFGIF